LGPGCGPVGLCPSSLFFLFILFILFRFLISFIDFAKMLQINSNQFVKFSRIQLNILRQ
jgi:hypothetical protein